MVSHWGSEAGLDSSGREGGRSLHSWGGEGSWDRGRRCLGPLTPGAPPWPHLARSFPGDYPCSSTSPQGQVPVRCELGREQPEPLSWAPPSPPRPQGLLPRPPGLTCGPQCSPEYQRSKAAQTSCSPHPRGGLWETPSQPQGPSLSAPLLSVGPCPSRTSSLPLLPTGSPGSQIFLNTNAAGD